MAIARRTQSTAPMRGNQPGMQTNIPGAGPTMAPPAQFQQNYYQGYPATGNARQANPMPPQAQAPAPMSAPPPVAAPAPAPAQGYSQPQPQAPVQNQSQQDLARDDSFVSMKIYDIHAKDKVIDFSAKLTKAYDCDFANIHGCGGKGHANNSTICLNLCDSNQKTDSGKSLNVSFCIDVQDMALLYHAAMNARMGLLSRGPLPPTQPSAEPLQYAIRTAMQQIGGMINSQPYQDDTRLIPAQALKALGKLLQDADMAYGTAAQKDRNQPNRNPEFLYTKQKNNPYAVRKYDGVDHAPVSQVTITFDSTRSYPWMIQISNFDAPIIRKSNGANSHQSQQAKHKRDAFIPVSADDFCAAMTNVDSFIRLWEHRMLPVIDAGCNRYEEIIAAKKWANQNR